MSGKKGTWCSRLGNVIDLLREKKSSHCERINCLTSSLYYDTPIMCCAKLLEIPSPLLLFVPCPSAQAMPSAGSLVPGSLLPHSKRTVQLVDIVEIWDDQNLRRVSHGLVNRMKSSPSITFFWFRFVCARRCIVRQLLRVLRVRGDGSRLGGNLFGGSHVAEALDCAGRFRCGRP